MVLELSTTTRSAIAETSHATGTDIFDLVAGKKLKIETSPGGEEILNIDVPAGKNWNVSVTVSYSETDA